MDKSLEKDIVFFCHVPFGGKSLIPSIYILDGIYYSYHSKDHDQHDEMGDYDSQQNKRNKWFHTSMDLGFIFCFLLLVTILTYNSKYFKAHETIIYAD